MTVSFPVSIKSIGIDGSGTIFIGGTAQQLFSNTIPSNGFAIYNCDTTNNIYINIGGTATIGGAGTICITPLGGYETPSTYSPEGIVSVIGSTTGQSFTAKRW